MINFKCPHCNGDTIEVRRYWQGIVLVRVYRCKINQTEFATMEKVQE